MWKVIVWIFLICSTRSVYGQEMDVMTYNIRFANPADGDDQWDLRKAEWVAFIDSVRPAILGIQEGLFSQVDYIDEKLAFYAYTGVGRDDGRAGGEYSAIFYDTSVVRYISGSTFWLSENPDSISVGWDASMERICTYAHFASRSSGKRFWVFNTHFDHLGEQSRTFSAELIKAKIKAFNPAREPVILMGDLNALPTSIPIKLLQLSFVDPVQRQVVKLEGPAGTFNGFGSAQNDRRIDYIFTRGMTVRRYVHLTPERSNGRHLSDHFPVLASISL